MTLLAKCMAGCGFAPMNTADSARSLGEDKIELSGDLLPAMAASIGYGVTESTDIHAAIENQFVGFLFSAWVKQNFLNNPEGWSVSAVAGGFASNDGPLAKGYFLAPIVSYGNPGNEFYSQFRFNHVDVGRLEYNYGNKHVIELKDELKNFDYWQVDFGLKVRSRRVAVKMGLSCFIYKNSGCLPVPFFGVSKTF